MSPTGEDAESQALALLESVLPAGTRFGPEASAPGADFTAATPNGDHLRIVVKRHSQPRYEQLEGALARGWAILGSVPIPMVLLSVPQLTDGIRTTVEEFRDRFLPELGFGVIGDDGSHVLDVPQLGIHSVGAGSFRVRPKRKHGSVARELFTPGYQFLAKRLLMQGKSDRYWQPPSPSQRGPYRSAGELARSVSDVIHESTVHRFVRTFQQAGFIAKRRGELALSRRGELIDAWLDHSKYRRPELYPMRSIFDETPDAADLLVVSTHAQHWGVIAGFEACRLRGWLHAASPGLEIHIAPGTDIARLAGDLDLQPCEASQATVTLVRTPLRGKTGDITEIASIWNHALNVDSQGRVRCVDAFQAALDCVRHPARGREQADYLIDQVLELRKDPDG